MAEGTELRDLDIRELSGVDEAANGFVGWLLQKSTSTSSTADVEQAAAAFTRLGSGLMLTEDSLEGAPDEVRKAHETLSGFVAELATADGESSVQSRVAGGLRKVLHSRKENVDRDELVALLAEREERILKAVDAALEDYAEDIRKAASGDKDDNDEGGADLAARQESIEQTLAAQNETFAEVMTKTLDRLENVEKFLTSRQSAPEQETESNADASDEGKLKKSAESALDAAFLRAGRGERVVLGGN